MSTFFEVTANFKNGGNHIVRARQIVATVERQKLSDEEYMVLRKPGSGNWELSQFFQEGQQFKMNGEHPEVHGKVYDNLFLRKRSAQ